MKKLELLKTHFGYDRFRPLQEEIIDNVLGGNDLMVVMPTGGGKSMCFQLPALLMDGITLVISPLIALMKDQVDSLRQNGIKAGYYNSSQEAQEQKILLRDLEQGNIKLLYVAPESIALLQNHLKSITVSLIAVDEAHCISTWGHDFRPAYTQLAYLKKSFPLASMIALTATADRATRQDIKDQLGISTAQEFIASFDRPNITLTVRPGNERMSQMRRFLNKFPNEAGIVYCLSRKTCESLADKLNAYGFNAAAYHAGIEHRLRESVQEQFINDKIKIVCATIAFGMGIDKSNVRFVVHYNMPKNIEGYYQEIGRAGRDGIDSKVLLFHSYADMIQLRKFADGSGNSEVQIAKLERMKQFAEALTCRRRMLLSYFNEYLEKDCGNCDVCLNKPDFFEATTTAQKALSAVYRMREQASLNLLIDVLRGASNATVMESGFNAIKTYGSGKEISWNHWQQYIIQLINQGLLEIAFHQQNHLKLTPQSHEVLFKDRKVELAVIPVPGKEGDSGVQTGNDLPTQVNKDLFEALRKLRFQLANKEDVAPYLIFNDASLKDMAVRIPLNDNEFADVTGVGSFKQDKYGKIFLKLLTDFKMMRESDFVFRSESPRKKKGTAKSAGRTDTVLETVELFWKGKTIEQIAAQRSLAISTIFSHLGKRYRSHRDVKVKDFIKHVDMQKVEKLWAIHKEQGSVKPVFEALDGTLDYDTLRLAINVMEADAIFA